MSEETPPTFPPPPVAPRDPVAEAKARSRRNIALALGLVAFIAVVYAVTVLRMGGYVASRPF